MASVQEPGLIRLYRKQPNGNKTLIFQDRVEALAPGGGAPDGAPASVKTPDTWMVVDSQVVLANDDILEVTVENDATDGLDASDCIWRIPTVTPQGSKSLGRAQFANPTFSDVTVPLSQEITIAGYKVVEGALRLTGRIYLDIQDDTA